MAFKTLSICALLGATSLNSVCAAQAVDLTGDSVADILDITVGYHATQPAIGSATVTSGSTSTVVFTATGGAFNDRFGYAHAVLHRSDQPAAYLAISSPLAPRADGWGTVTLFSIATEAEVWSSSVPLADIGRRAAMIADQDFDGAEEVLVEGVVTVSGVRSFRSYLFSGLSGELLSSYTANFDVIVTASQQGTRIFIRTDLDGDGLVDADDVVLVTQALQGDPGLQEIGDIDGNGVVDQDDVAYVVADFGAGVQAPTFGSSGGSYASPQEGWDETFGGQLTPVPAQCPSCGSEPFDPTVIDANLPSSGTCGPLTVQLHCAPPGTLGPVCAFYQFLETQLRDPIDACWTLTGTQIGSVPGSHWWESGTCPQLPPNTPPGEYQLVLTLRVGSCCMRLGCMITVPEPGPDPCAGGCNPAPGLVEIIGGPVPPPPPFPVRDPAVRGALGPGDSTEFVARIVDVNGNVVPVSGGRWIWGVEVLNDGTVPLAQWWTEDLNNGQRLKVRVSDLVVDQTHFRVRALFIYDYDCVGYPCGVSGTSDDFYFSPDQDVDNLVDYHEEQSQCTNASNPLSDGDTLTDGEEVWLYHTDPCDDESHPDVDPKLSDLDQDGLSDREEWEHIEVVVNGETVYQPRSHPLKFDTDNDGIHDLAEVWLGFNPRVPAHPSQHSAFRRIDRDHDLLADQFEQQRGWDADNPDQDGDFIVDGLELLEGLGSPAVPTSGPGGGSTSEGGNDTDGDGLSDALELHAGTDPLTVDTDYDGIDDAMELALGLDPIHFDMDGDDLIDGWEILFGLDPLTHDYNQNNTPDQNEDPDGDGVTNRDESLLGTSPWNSDSDGDGVSDLVEFQQDSNPTNSADFIPASGDPTKRLGLLQILVGQNSYHPSCIGCNPDHTLTELTSALVRYNYQSFILKFCEDGEPCDPFDYDENSELIPQGTTTRNVPVYSNAYSTNSISLAAHLPARAFNGGRYAVAWAFAGSGAYAPARCENNPSSLPCNVCAPPPNSSYPCGLVKVDSTPGDPNRSTAVTHYFGTSPGMVGTTQLPHCDRINAIAHRAPALDPGESIISDAEEESVGLQLVPNLDNDDGDNQFDVYDDRVQSSAITRDNELARVTIQVDAATKPGYINLAAVGVRVWRRPFKDSELTNVDRLLVPEDFGTQRQLDIYVEATGADSVFRQSSLSVIYTPNNEFIHEEHECSDVIMITRVGVESLRWKPRGNAINPADTTFDADPNWPSTVSLTGISGTQSYRVFPEALLVNGQVEQLNSADYVRDIVDLEITLTVPPIEPLDVLVRSIDTDDPTRDVYPVDDETADEDNRGNVGELHEGEFVPQGGTGIAWVTFQPGEALRLATFRPTVQPGDNFRAVAAFDEEFVLSLANPDNVASNTDGQGAPLPATATDRQRIICTSINKPTWAEREILLAGNYASPVLTVWRRLHLELDTMSTPDLSITNSIIDIDGDGDTTPGWVAIATPMTTLPYGPSGMLIADDSPSLDRPAGQTSGNGTYAGGRLGIGSPVVHELNISKSGDSRLEAQSAGFDLCRVYLPLSGNDGQAGIEQDTVSASITAIRRTGAGSYRLDTVAENFISYGGNSGFVTSGGTATCRIAGGGAVTITAVGEDFIDVSSIEIPVTIRTDDPHCVNCSLPPPDWSVLTTALQGAYVVPLADTTMDSTIPFARFAGPRLESDGDEGFVNLARDTRGSALSTQHCWVVQAISAYAPDPYWLHVANQTTYTDNDADLEHTHRIIGHALIPPATGTGQAILIYHENFRDVQQLTSHNSDPPRPGKSTLKQQTFVHEIGHSLGLMHTEQHWGRAQGWIMDGNNVTSFSGPAVFGDGENDIIRRARFPGDEIMPYR